MIRCIFSVLRGILFLSHSLVKASTQTPINRPNNEPTILVGWSNHSDESCRKNDENNLLIRGDHRIIAVMATEFLRMYDHYKSRDFINSMQRNTADPDDKFLKETEAWAATSFNPQSRSHKFRDREVFAGRP
jgi:hypothetical protein